ncbi:uncharacterized protein LOC123698744 [Colias croceus]|uniref:uncharacterized protein LOC123698744 n=1 Tax=Colias crocea TaxID=72248 RepID=UPI001E27F052|nr:uncharacterized protein LOC123698744 [Colias croceus]
MVGKILLGLLLWKFCFTVAGKCYQGCSSGYGYEQPGYEYGMANYMESSAYNPATSVPNNQPIVIVIKDDDKFDLRDWLEILLARGDNDAPTYIPYPVPVPCCSCGMSNCCRN